MYRVANMIFSGQINYNAGDDHRMIAIVVPDTITEQQLVILKNAELLEVLGNDENDVIGSYRLTGWRRVEKVPNGIQIMWATITTVDLDSINARIDEQEEALNGNAVELSDILDAITELGDLVAELLTQDEPVSDDDVEYNSDVEEGE